jgi:hypothetical protein
MISAERSLPTPCPGERLPLTRIEVGQLRGKDDACARRSMATRVSG